MKTRLSILTVVFGVSVLAQVSIGIRIGPPPAPRIIRVQPVSPGSGYMWVDGYQYPVGNRYRWHEGYWTRPPYDGARWEAPRYDGQSYFEGRWAGDHAEIGHDHRWDRDRDRDYNREDRRGRGRR